MPQWDYGSQHWFCLLPFWGRRVSTVFSAMANSCCLIYTDRPLSSQWAYVYIYDQLEEQVYLSIYLYLGFDDDRNLIPKFPQGTMSTWQRPPSPHELLVITTTTLVQIDIELGGGGELARVRAGPSVRLHFLEGPLSLLWYVIPKTLKFKMQANFVLGMDKYSVRIVKRRAYHFKGDVRRHQMDASWFSKCGCGPGLSRLWSACVICFVPEDWGNW